MKKHYSISELFDMNLEILKGTARTIQNRANRENWPYVEVACQGGKNGKRREYTPPPPIMAQIKEREMAKVLADTAPKLPALTTTAIAKIEEINTTEAQRTREGARLAVLKTIEQLMAESGVSKEAAITTLLTQAKMPNFEHVAKMFELALDERGASGGLPSSRTIKRWFAQRESHTLTPKVAQADMDMPVWLPLFLQCYRLPTKPSVLMAYESFVAALAKEMPLVKVPSIHAVRRAMSKVGKVALQDGRKGKRELKNDLPFKRREFLHLPPAAIYTADGHTIDAEVLNPMSGLPFRPEITTVVDVATRRCMGWSVGLAESRFTVLEALCHASRAAIGSVWYVDWGKGFENLMMTDEATGVLGRLGMTMKHARAYNSQAKGASERSHNIFTRAAKKLPTYVGKDMDQEARKALYHWTRREIKLQGKIVASPIPTWDEFKAFIEAEIEAYNNKPHRSLLKFTDDNGKNRHMTPNEMWALKVAEFGEPPKVLPEDEGWLFRPQKTCTVRRGEVQLFNNVYFSSALEEFNGERLRVGYDVQDAQWVWIYDDVGRLICKAEWRGNSQSYMPDSVIAQAMDKRNDAALKRVEIKRDNVLAERRQQIIEHQSSVNLGGLVLDMEQLKAQGQKVLAKQPEAETLEAVYKFVPNPEPAWEAPDSNATKAQYAEYKRLSSMSRDSLSEPQQKWLDWYANSGRMELMEEFMRAYG
ncbi:Mu transposase C-terminal domain-containing protein [Neisseria montereyensis]|uniref:Mu transposase C-terminal domain-containing protein n=1 Tax=Neisseria montereyensis TaxID=2973938 RepID=A0ABT2FDS4_9NEIS|nr:Mu transposase C-terminal domain-containing protein [Neisseria montereyensis]MCS4534280.1 Mu transposase C-terminal domain-containing protein [Neisseria montereyensis]